VLAALLAGGDDEASGDAAEAEARASPGSRSAGAGAAGAGRRHLPPVRAREVRRGGRRVPRAAHRRHRPRRAGGEARRRGSYPGRTAESTLGDARLWLELDLAEGVVITVSPEDARLTIRRDVAGEVMYDNGTGGAV
jgi:hypothetical protein